MALCHLSKHNLIVVWVMLRCYIYVVSAPSTVVTSQFSNEEKSSMGAESASIVQAGVNQTSSSQVVPDKNYAAALMEGLEEVPPPKTTKTDQLNNPVGKYDPIVLDKPNACERNYAIPCPEKFEIVGDLYGDNSELCSPSSEYDGPCAGRVLNITNISATTRRHWATQCATNWPCVRCKKRNFSLQCPSTWVPKETDSQRQVCVATPQYTGPCSGYDMDFAGFNVEMKKKWSDACYSWWPCLTDDENIEGPDPDFPVTRQATVWRLFRGLQD